MTFFRAAAVFAAAAAAAAAASAETGGASAGADDIRIPEDFGRYEVILDKSPFGAPPPSSGADSASGVSGGPGAAPGAADAAAQAEEAPLKMSSVSRFGGVPAAGFVDGETGVPFILRPGEGYAGYRLVDLDPDIGAAVVARGTNEWLVSLSWAQGQPTNIVPSARDPYFTAFRPERSAAVAAASTKAAPPPKAAVPPPPPGFAAAAAKRRPADTSSISPEEEAALVAQATVADPDGSSHVSFRELNRLRAQLRRRKAEEARAREIAAAEEARRLHEEEKADDDALAAAERREEEEKAKRQRRALIEAIARGYAVGEDVELTDDEAEVLREAGFNVPGG